MMNNKPVSYLQTDPKWKNKSYSTKGESTTIGASGCGPTCMAMVISTWTDKKVTPVDTCKWSVDHGYKAYKNGTYHSYFTPQAAAYGLSCIQINSSLISDMSATNAAKVHQIAKDYVLEGNLVICLMGPGNWTKGGHYILWYSINNENNVYINDPASTASHRVKNTWSLLKSQVRKYWVIKVPKEVISMTNSEVKQLIKDEVAAAMAASKPATDTIPASWAKSAWYDACVKKIFDGSNPHGNVTREQIAAVLSRLNLLDANATVPADFPWNKIKNGNFQQVYLDYKAGKK